ncbi:hypothetical protein [Amycolatopsis pithecellobii]
MVEIIGEAANRVSPRVQAANPDVPWRAIIFGVGRGPRRRGR